MLPIDPSADQARRAWWPCPKCRNDHGCEECASSRNCGTHWQYLLSNQGMMVHLQCPACAHLWSADTRAKRRSAAA